MAEATGAFQRYRREVHPRLEARLQALVEADDLHDLYGYVVKGGKRVRPTLTLLVAEALGGEAQRALDLACSVELTHCASLALDDVLDGHGERRGRPTLLRERGVSVAVTTGFTLPSLAIHLASRYGRRYAEALSDAWVAMCLGAYREIEAREATWEGYRDLVELKTARLFATACAFGAAGARLQGVRAYGSHVGRAFQMADDLADGLQGDGATLRERLREAMVREAEAATALSSRWEIARPALREALCEAPAALTALKTEGAP